ncbi:MAG: alpha/beta hydrolase-fold protein, partial [Saprospiraceae bacterium]
VAYNWKIDGYTYPKKYYPIIELVADNFDIPQMGKSRRVRAVLPYNYYQTDKQYPVIYMQDGQNLFDNAAPFGNWGMDKKMAVLTDMGAGDFIIVCVDHAESDRILEYNPYRKTSIGFGEGKKYVRFLADTLKPFIDKKYRTKTERQFTGVGGSSMGGLISIYAGLMLPKIFGRLLVFSPSLWVSANILSDSVRYTNIDDTRVYIYAGGNEGSSMIPNAQRFRTALEQQGIGEESIDIFFSIDPDGKHTESRWGAEFPKAIKWLFF